MASAPKGTKDILPSEVYKWHFIEETAKEIAACFNVKEIRTPIFEHTEVFWRGVGEGTDIVNKEMYTFNDKGGRSITLKPEGTAGIARAFTENGLNNLAFPVKLFYITPCFRYERPQAGRLRQFHQFGVEFLGSPSPQTDAEVIILARAFFNALGIKGLTLNINSIGCDKCRKKYVEALKNYLIQAEETVDAGNIIDIVCKYYNLKKDELLARKRTKEVAEARQIAMFLITEFINMPLASVGAIFGKDHATVIYAKNKVADDMKTNQKLSVQINDMKQMIKCK